MLQGVALTWWELCLSILGGLVVLWLALIGALWWSARTHGESVSLGELLRLAPDVVRLLRRLVVDPTVPRGARIWLGVLLVYLLSPIDLIPDFVPVLGYADDAIIVAVVLRFATKHAGADALARHWPGTPQGLRALCTFAGIRDSSTE
jgi:uncharacterized membrane protein YkvA (DUF1232 family)